MRTHLPHIAVGMIVIGILDALYLYISHTAGASLVCGVLDGCNEVAASPYSIVFGIPLSFLGLVFYIGMLAVASLLYYQEYRRVAKGLFLLGAAVGVAMSAYFTYLQAFVIEAWCMYCLISAAVTLLLLVISVLLYRDVETDSLESVDGPNHSAPRS